MSQPHIQKFHVIRLCKKDDRNKDEKKMIELNVNSLLFNLFKY